MPYEIQITTNGQKLKKKYESKHLAETAAAWYFQNGFSPKIREVEDGK